MSIVYDELPGWTFEVSEASAGVYRVIGIDRLGRRAETTGSDLDASLAWCKSKAEQLALQSPAPDFRGQVEAVEHVEQLLARMSQALEAAGIAYAVIGGNAVAAWVATIDSGAVRATKDVDILLDRSDWPRVSEVLMDHGFLPVEIHGVYMFVDAKNPNPKTGIHVLMANELVRPHETHPSPGLSARVRLGGGYDVIDLPNLVEMKLQANRRVDQVHIEDMLRTGVIRQSLIDQLPTDLRERLEHIRATM